MNQGDEAFELKTIGTLHLAEREFLTAHVSWYNYFVSEGISWAYVEKRSVFD
jgi:hypothetical protein